MSLATVTILSNGKEMDQSVDLLSVDIVKEVNRIPYADIVLLDGDAALQKFEVSDTAFFVPGNPVEIMIEDAEKTGAPTSIFKGVVIRHAVSADSLGSVLRVELRDTAVKMTTTRRSAVYRDKSDDKVIGDLITKGGLKKGTVAATKITHKELVQYHCSDWDFMLTRAEVLGLFVIADDGEVSLPEIKISGSPKYTYEFGIDQIYGFEIEIDAGTQVPDVQSMAYDVKKQEPTKAAKSKAFALSQGNLDAQKAAKDVGIQSYILSSYVSLDPAELTAWSDARLIQRRMAWIRGRITVPGVPDLKRMDVIELAGIGTRFNGKALVTGIRQRVDRKGWQTDIEFGFSAQRYAERTDIIDAPAAGLLPGVNGLQIGLITSLEADPDKELRVKVKLPGLDEQDPAVWARVASPDAGAGRGYFFRPEVGDEVVVGFFNDDPRQAVVLGSLYGSKTKQPKGLAEPDDKNLEKGIVTKKGTTIKFVDNDKASLVIQTASANTITLDDDAQQIEIKDQHGNTITMSKDGIVLKSAKDFKIDASGNVEIKGAKVDVK